MQVFNQIHNKSKFPNLSNLSNNMHSTMSTPTSANSVSLRKGNDIISHVAVASAEPDTAPKKVTSVSSGMGSTSSTSTKPKCDIFGRPLDANQETKQPGPVAKGVYRPPIRVSTPPPPPPAKDEEPDSESEPETEPESNLPRHPGFVHDDLENRGITGNIVTSGAIVMGPLKLISSIAAKYNALTREEKRQKFHKDYPRILHALSVSEIKKFVDRAPGDYSLVPERLRRRAYKKQKDYGFGLDFVFEHCLDHGVVLRDIPPGYGVLCGIALPNGSRKYPNVDLVNFTEKTESWDESMEVVNPVSAKKPHLSNDSFFDEPIVNTMARGLLEEFGLDISKSDLALLDTQASLRKECMASKMAMYVDIPSFTNDGKKTHKYTRCYALLVDDSVMSCFNWM
jgi:hypothetical protein